MNDVAISRLLERTGLGRGAHWRREDGMCAMELVAYLAGEEHTFAPACASELLTGFTIRLNDSMRPDEREQLKPFLPRLVGTRQGDERRRFEAMSGAVIAHLFAPDLDRREAPRSAAPGILAQFLRGLESGDPDMRSRAILSRGLRQALSNAVNAADRHRDGPRPNWNWCGGELGIAVADASRNAGDGDWSIALRILEAGIDACPADRPEAGSAPDDSAELTRAASYVCI